MSTKISWTDETWNPVVGCSPVSAGCEHCYAARLAHRGLTESHRGLTRMTEHGPKWNGGVRLLPERLDQPLRWRKPRRVFVCSMSDLFHDRVPNEFIGAVFGVMEACPQHTFQILTKRPERALQWFRWITDRDGPPEHEAGGEAHGCSHLFGDVRGEYEASLKRSDMAAYADYLAHKPQLGCGHDWWEWPLPNVWLGVSVENQKAADERIPLLLQTPAAVRFVSAEPLLEKVQLSQSWKDYLAGWDTEAEHGRHDERGNCVECPVPVQVQTERLDWVIVGGESGPGARPCRVEWIRDVVMQCRESRVPVFVKQVGSHCRGSAEGFMVDRYEIEEDHWYQPPCLGGNSFWRPNTYIGFRTYDRKGGNPLQWPDDIRVRQLPVALDREEGH